MLENKVRMKYIGIIYDCTLIGTNHKNRQVLINDHKDLNNLIQEMNKKTKGSHYKVDPVSRTINKKVLKTK